MAENKPPQVDGKQFKRICFEIARRKGGRSIEFTEPRHPANFYNVRAEILNQPVHFLLNEHHPYLAFASVVEVGGIVFMDDPILSEEFAPYYKVLDTWMLNAPANLSNNPDKRLALLNQLNRAELEQLKYWWPETVGQLIFNYWD